MVCFDKTVFGLLFFNFSITSVDQNKEEEIFCAEGFGIIASTSISIVALLESLHQRLCIHVSSNGV